MTVQIQPAKPKDEHNGLADLEEELLGHPEREVVAIVTYGVAKIVDDKKKAETYPVVYVKHIEPVMGEESASAARDLQVAAYKARTGADELDFDGLEDDAPEGGLHLVGDEGQRDE